MSRPFDPPSTRYGPGHRGADLPGGAGAPVRAAGAGRIAFASLLAGRGVIVVVHGELRTTYEPVAAAVTVGQQVAAGSVVGQLSTGHQGCPGTCLHWGLLRGAVYLDPVRLVRAGPSRLLPLDNSVLAPAAVGAAPLVAPAPHWPADGPGSRIAAPVRHPHPVQAPATAAPSARPATAPRFAFRVADAAGGTVALLALIAGLALLRRPAGPRGSPTTPSLAASPVQPMGGGPLTGAARVAGAVVDLTSERQRRRPDVA